MIIGPSAIERWYIMSGSPLENSYLTTNFFGLCSYMLAGLLWRGSIFPSTSNPSIDVKL